MRVILLLTIVLSCLAQEQATCLSKSDTYIGDNTIGTKFDNYEILVGNQTDGMRL